MAKDNEERIEIGPNGRTIPKKDYELIVKLMTGDNIIERHRN